VVANLVDNAHRHSPAGVQVRLAAAADPTGVTLQVVDHGPGVAPADRERIFLAFQRLDDRSTTSGVGLGLAIARGFTEAMGGNLRPADTPGGGLTMALTLPLARPEAATS
jgi:two-component system sensor histidine kinase KdpD